MGEGSGTTKAAGPIRRWSSGGPRGSGVRSCRVAGKGMKKAGGPIWPTARGSSGGRSCRLRSSSRWAQISRARRPGSARRLVGGSRRSVISGPLLEWGGIWPRSCEPSGSLRVGSGRCQPSADDRSDRARGVPLPALGDREAGPLEHPEGAVIGVRRGDLLAGRCRPDRPRASSRHGRGHSPRLPRGAPSRRPGAGRGARRRSTRCSRPGCRRWGRGSSNGQAGEVLARSEAHPADRPIAPVGDRPGARHRRSRASSSARLPAAVEFVQSRPRTRK